MFDGCGCALMSATFPNDGINLLGVPLAGKRFPYSYVLPLVVSRTLGGTTGATALYVIASEKAGFSLAGGFASNGCAEHSPGACSMIRAFWAEFILMMMFWLIPYGATDKCALASFAPLAIGLTLIY